MQTEPPEAEPPKRKRRWLQFSLRTLMIGVTLLAVACAYVAHEAKIAEELAQSIIKLRQIAVAMSIYRSQFSNTVPAVASGTFPAAYIADKDGKALLSWRVEILPFVGEEKLYKEFHLDEPWDSQHNKALIPRMPKVFAAPGSNAAKEFKTNYLVPRGDDTIFTGEKKTRVNDIHDGTSKTILVVEANEDRAVIWTKPDDYEIDPKQPNEGLVGMRRGGFLATFADGSVHSIKDTAKPETIKALFTRAGREATKNSDFE